MRIVGVAASIFGLKCLEALRQLDGCELVGVVTAPKKFPISYRPEGVNNVLFADVADFCAAQKIPCETLSSGMSDPSLVAKVKSWGPDIFVVAGWYHLLPFSWRNIAPAYGLHASLLPKYSGGAPLVWAMINGERETGISFFQFDAGVDSGPLVGQKKVSIEASDTIATLYAKIEILGLELISEVLPKLADGTAEHVAQNETQRTLFPQRSPEDGAIDFFQPVSALYNFIRAQTKPYPGAFFHRDNDIVKVWAVEAYPQLLENTKPGPFWDGEGNLFIVGLDHEALKVTLMTVVGAAN